MQRKGTVARILIAEDEDAIRNLIARALRQDGHDVITKPFSLGVMRRAVNDALCAPPRRRH